MKDISETHPSIKRIFQAREDSSVFVLAREVQAHTIDKAVLREIWERNAKKYLPDDSSTGEAQFIAAVAKELGLEGDK